MAVRTLESATEVVSVRVPTSSHARNGLYRSLRHRVFIAHWACFCAQTHESRGCHYLSVIAVWAHLSHFFVKRVHSVAGVFNVARRQWRIVDGQWARGSTLRHRRRRVRHGIVAASMTVLFLTPFLKCIGVAYFHDHVLDILLTDTGQSVATMSVPAESERLALGMWTVFQRLPRIRQSLAWCLVRLTNTRNCIYWEVDSRFLPYFARLVRQWIHAHASVPEVFRQFAGIST